MAKRKAEENKSSGTVAKNAKHNEVKSDNNLLTRDPPIPNGAAGKQKHRSNANMNGKSRNSQKVPKLKLQDKYKHQSIPKIIVTDGIANFATPGNNGNVNVFSAGTTETNYKDGGQMFKFSVEAEDTIGDSDEGEQDSSGSDSDSLDDT